MPVFYFPWQPIQLLHRLSHGLTLAGGTLQPGIYTDLGTGVSYGSYPVAASAVADQFVLEITLPQAAVDSINAKDGCTPTPGPVECLWAIGGSFVADWPFPNTFTYAFGNSGEEEGGGGVRQLIYDTSPIPVPGTIFLVGPVLLGLGVVRRKKA